MKTNISILFLAAITLALFPLEHFGFEYLKQGKAFAENVKTSDRGISNQIPIVAQASQEWNVGPRLFRVFDNNGNFLGIGIQLNVLNKPVTKYANVVYQLSVGKEGRWLDLYSSVGARLLPKTAGSLFAPVEIISINEIANQLGTSVNALPDLDLRAIALIKYDTRELREQSIAIESIQSYKTIPQASLGDLASQTQPTRVPTVEIKPTRPLPQTVTPTRPTAPVTTPTVIPANRFPGNPNVDPADAELGISGDIAPR
jgi:hypothetical protein